MQPKHMPPALDGVESSESNCLKSLFFSSLTGERFGPAEAPELFFPSCNWTNAAGPALPLAPSGYASQIALIGWPQDASLRTNSSKPAVTTPFMRTFLPSKDSGWASMSQMEASTTCAPRGTDIVEQKKRRTRRRFITASVLAERIITHFVLEGGRVSPPVQRRALR